MIYFGDNKYMDCSGFVIFICQKGEILFSKKWIGHKQR